MAEPFDVEPAKESEFTDQFVPMRHLFMSKYHIASVSFANKRNFAADQIAGHLVALEEFDPAY